MLLYLLGFSRSRLSYFSLVEIFRIVNLNFAFLKFLSLLCLLSTYLSNLFIRKAVNDYRELKLLLDMYKGVGKEQRDKVQLMAAEKKARQEVEELKAQVRNATPYLLYLWSYLQDKSFLMFSTFLFDVLLFSSKYLHLVLCMPLFLCKSLILVLRMLVFLQFLSCYIYILLLSAWFSLPFCFPQVKKLQESKREERKKLADEEAIRKIKQLEDSVHQLQRQVAVQKQVRPSMHNTVNLYFFVHAGTSFFLWLCFPVFPSLTYPALVGCKFYDNINWIYTCTTLDKWYFVRCWNF